MAGHLAEEYWGNLKPSTAVGYASNLNAHIRPGLGAVRLVDLHPHIIQGFINSLDGLAPSTVHHVYKVLHLALAKAVEMDYIPHNPTALMAAAKGRDMEYFISVALFTPYLQVCGCQKYWVLLGVPLILILIQFPSINSSL